MSSPWWNTAPGGAKSDADGTERVPAEHSGVGYTLTIAKIKGYIVSTFASVITTFQKIITGSIQFNLAAGVSVAEGEQAWNVDEGTMDVGLGDGVVGQMFEETFYPVKNQTGSLIPDKTFVMFAGTLGASGKLLITPAVTDGTMPSHLMMGLTTHDIANGADGKVTWFGKVRDVPTNGTAEGEVWADEDLLYPKAGSPGILTNVEPAAPNLNIPVAAVVHTHATAGVLFVRPKLSHMLTELSDVNGTALDTNGQLMVWDHDNGYHDFTDNINNYARLLGRSGGQTINGGTGAGEDITIVSTSHATKGSINLGSGVTVSAVGQITTDSGIITQQGILSKAANWTLFLNSGRNYTTADDSVSIAQGTASNSSGQFNAVHINPTYNQSGTASATDLLVNRTETAVGSGLQLLADLQVGGVSKFSVDNAGTVELAGHLELQGSAYTSISSTYTIPATGNVLWLKLTSATTITLPAIPASTKSRSIAINIDCNGYAVSWAGSPTIVWSTSDQSAPTLDTTAGVINRVPFESNQIDSEWMGDFGGTTG